jgi:hypothetical protein
MRFVELHATSSFGMMEASIPRRSQKIVSQLSFLETESLAAKSGLVCAPCASAQFAPIDVPQSNS